MKKPKPKLKKTKPQDAIASWQLSYDHFDPAQEGLREALCTLANGYFGTRGASPESAVSKIHYPGTYIAGVYNKLGTHIAGRKIFDESMVNCPNWLSLTFKIGENDWVSPSTVKILSYSQRLNLYTGVLERKMLIEDKEGRRTRVETERIVHMQNPHRSALKYVIAPLNYQDWVEFRSGLDGNVENTGVARYRQLKSKHLARDSQGTFDKSGIYLSVKTNQSKIRICEAEKIMIFSNEKEAIPLAKSIDKDQQAIYQQFKIFARKKKRYQIEKHASIFTSRDKGVKDPLQAAINAVKNTPRFEQLLKSHKLTWAGLWKDCDIQIKGDDFTQLVLRLHIFHLLQAASIHNRMIDAGLPARGLHGEAYRGHIFWDSLFVLHFYNFYLPQITKPLILYRHKRLSQARKYAKDNGYQGAMFPWQSGSTGEEETPTSHLNPLSGKWGPDYSRFQRHISFAIAYNVWQYWEMTEDLDFLKRFGAEMLLSIAQFGASLTRYNPKTGKFHVEKVMGPDEFHEKLPSSKKPGFKDNAYTNFLISWTLLKAQEAFSILPSDHKARLLKKLKLTYKEIESWAGIIHRINIIFNKDGIISQFDGYFDLKELDWKAYRKKYTKINRIDIILKAEGRSPDQYKAAKQADVLMIFYLFPLSEVKDLFRKMGYRFDRKMLKNNYEYYIKRTSHGSTLSKVVHCYIAGLLGKEKDASYWFSEVLKSDIYDTQGGTTLEGIHAGVMGGSVDIVIRCFAGINLLKDRIKLNPNLPKGWQSFKLNFQYKGNNFSLSIVKNQIRLLISGSGPKKKRLKIPVEIGEKLYYLSFGKRYKIAFS